MTYDIETISQSELLQLLVSISERFSVDAIDVKKCKKELSRIELLQRQKQIARTIDASGYSREEILAVLQNMNKK